MTLKVKILALLSEVAQLTDCELISTIEHDTVLLESGLDSLGFAILVARLEEELDLDPFSAMTDVVYPRTFAEFVAIYDQASHA